MHNIPRSSDILRDVILAQAASPASNINLHGKTRDARHICISLSQIVRM